ncbi:uncharacterized protein MELLADRAFT_114537 [Melampsora larici-populina 98AG31]|uniref:Uncharacterized protein n=1 Tax=Melampsora larici-populina (strain 98AG31 / pathotype 3-4-7) TaxID=747676 RepID=F4SDV4_MELLP|nr:uncharacterized protein MELLADRAFT_114537 [Melampsora larici-populina 98AG31]EGF97174.1 hypothetical protein MELLADRAFT_114537 [Melampsora larici-populina 98AG31]
MNFLKSQLKTKSSQLESNSNLSLPSDPLRHLEHLPLLSILVPILGSHLHGSLIDWQNIIFCLILFIYIFNLINLPWQMLKSSQFIQPIDLNPDSKPIDPLTIKLFFLATSFKPVEYLLSRLREGTLFGKPIRPTSMISNGQIELIDLIGRFEDTQTRIRTLEKRLASDPELDSLRSDTELILGKVAFQLNQRSTHLDRSLESEMSQMMSLIQKLNQTKESIEKLEKEIEKNIKIKEDEKSWVWDLVLNVVQKLARLKYSQKKLII